MVELMFFQLLHSTSVSHSSQIIVMDGWGYAKISRVNEWTRENEKVHQQQLKNTRHDPTTIVSKFSSLFLDVIDDRSAACLVWEGESLVVFFNVKVESKGSMSLSTDERWKWKPLKIEIIERFFLPLTILEQVLALLETMKTFFTAFQDRDHRWISKILTVWNFGVFCFSSNVIAMLTRDSKIFFLFGDDDRFRLMWTTRRRKKKFNFKQRIERQTKLTKSLKKKEKRKKVFERKRHD